MLFVFVFVYNILFNELPMFERTVSRLCESKIWFLMQSHYSKRSDSCSIFFKSNLSYEIWSLIVLLHEKFTSGKRKKKERFKDEKRSSIELKSCAEVMKIKQFQLKLTLSIGQIILSTSNNILLEKKWSKI